MRVKKEQRISRDIVKKEKKKEKDDLSAIITMINSMHSFFQLLFIRFEEGG